MRCASSPSAGLPGSQENRVVRARALSFYLQDEIRVDDWVLTPGLRYEETCDTLGFVAKTKLEIVCAAADKDKIIAVIREHARTGRHGDGKIFVSTVDEAEDIRTGAKGRDVI